MLKNYRYTYPIGIDISNLYKKPSKKEEKQRLEQFKLDHEKYCIENNYNIFDRYYTYIYLDPRFPKKYYKVGNYKFEYPPFYIGKGMYERCFAHIFERGDSIKHRTIRAIKNELNRRPIIMKLNDNVPEYIAFELERYLIDSVGRVNQCEGILTNKIAGNKFKLR